MEPQSFIPHFDAEWTLFLDRDGVLNKRIMGGYVENPSLLEVIPSVPKAIRHLNEIFGRVVVVTNQQGIGKGLYTAQDLAEVHQVLLSAVKKEGGHIDAFFHCPHLASLGCDCRKPGVGMGHQAKAQFPEIDFEKSVMVGDSPSDIVFGNQLGMWTVAITDQSNFPAEANQQFPAVWDWAKGLKQG